MLRFKALGFGNAWNVVMGGLCSVAGPAEDLQVLRCICATHSEGQNVVNVPRFSGVDLLSAVCAFAFSFQEEAQPE